MNLGGDVAWGVFLLEQEPVFDKHKVPDPIYGKAVHGKDIELTLVDVDQGSLHAVDRPCQANFPQKVAQDWEPGKSSLRFQSYKE